jgi:hypothetical protein
MAQLDLVRRMSALRHRAVSRALAVLLPFALCISIGMVTGIQGGLHNEAASQYRSDHILAMNGIHQEIRLYGALILLITLSASALSILAIFVSGMFPASHKTTRGLRLRKV